VSIESNTESPLWSLHCADQIQRVLDRGRSGAEAKKSFDSKSYKCA
jgi:hypothetical protein